VPAVQIAISSTEDGWQVEVRRGSRVAVKRTDVSPGAVSAVAEALSITELAVAVGEVNDAARLAVEQRAAQLRTELAELEAALARHRQPS
jgi:hypothetical protein